MTTKPKATVKLAVTNPNSAAKDDAFSAADYSWLSENGSLKGNLAVLANDPGAATLWAVSTEQPPASGPIKQEQANSKDEFFVEFKGVSYRGELTLNADGTVGFDLGSLSGLIDSLAHGQSITSEFYYTARMANGTLSTSKVVVSITGTNDGPVAVADVAAGTENETLQLDVLANDIDVDAGAIKSLVSASVSEGQGSASIENGKVVFNPGTAYDSLPAGQTARVVVSYTMKDEHGAESSSTVTITITGTNDGPVAVADVAAGTENETLQIDVLANDIDVDAGAIKSLVSASVSEGQGSASIENGRSCSTRVPLTIVCQPVRLRGWSSATR
jgi:VCBS repeat-containing protein